MLAALSKKVKMLPTLSDEERGTGALIDGGNENGTGPIE
jgi:hypothetical protein